MTQLASFVTDPEVRRLRAFLECSDVTATLNPKSESAHVEARKEGNTNSNRLGKVEARFTFD
jgi:hypothetical protein